MKKLTVLIISVFLLVSGLSGCHFHSDPTVPGQESISSPSREELTLTGTETGTDELPSDTEFNTDSSSESFEQESSSSDEADSSEVPVNIYEDRHEAVYTTVNLNLRTAPSTDADILTVIPAQTQLLRTGYHEEWSRIQYSGQTVYAASEYLTTVAPVLSNEIYHYGYDPIGRDKYNAPGLINWHIRNWGAYADFIQDRESNLIYLTMDEGYENGNTPAILDVLKEKKVKAVFFLTESFVNTCPDLVQRMIDEGHILGNHTCAHPAAGMPSLSVEAQRQDIMKLHHMILDQFGYEMKLFRFPAGIYSEQSLNLVSSLGYRSVFWSFAYDDYHLAKQPDPAAALKKCVAELHPGAIYLLHAVSDTNTEILGDWIDAARANGFEFGEYPVY